MNKPRGFTLVESLVAISILLIGILSSFILVTRILAQALIIQDRLTASHLAQEGIELVRQIRDTNFIQQQTWNNGLIMGSYRVSVDSDTPRLLPLNNEPVLRYDLISGIFSYDTTDRETNFRRRINILPYPENNPRQIRVQSIVSWNTRGINFNLHAETYLFNWLGN